MLKPQLNKDQIYYLFNKEAQIERVKGNTNRKFTTDEPKKVIEEKPIPPEEPPKEDPLEIENDFLKEKVTELEDALRQTEQFKPATQLQQINLTDPNNLIEKAIMNDEHYFKWLADKADGTHSFYYDRYGFELFQTRILSQLKNSGVKVFRRLYFEV